MAVENELRELLRDKAEEMELPPEIPPPILRRARRRRMVNGALAAAVTAGLVAAVVVTAMTAFNQGSVTPAVSPTPSSTGPAVSPTATASSTSALEWRGIWPYITLAAALEAQTAADDGEQPWLLDAEQFVNTYARQELGWHDLFSNESLDMKDADESGPLAPTHLYV